MKTLVIALGLLMAATVAMAERPNSMQGGKSEQRRAQMQQELGLSNEQIQQMREIREQGGDRDEVQAVLTPEQQKKMANIRAGNAEKHEQRMTKMQAHLELTDEQVAQMQAIREQGGNRKEMQAVLTQEQQDKVAQRRGALSLGDKRP